VTAADPAGWRVGDVVDGRYEVRQAIHSGGMGVVHRVRHREWDVELAVKSPRAGLLATPGALADFVTEARTWVELGLHPHTVACVYVRTLDGLPRVFAEWVDGGSLAEVVRDGRLYRGGPAAALPRILDLAVQFARGLGHAHDCGLVHQDVKPANAMLTADGTLKVTDFGLAGARAAAGEGAGDRPPGASLLAGYAGMTPAYCSPEQAEASAGGPRVLTRATDTWSFALSVLEMFVGGPPVRIGLAAPEALAALLAAGRPPHPAVPALPPPLARLLSRCFADDPAARPPRLPALADELAGLYEELCGTPYPRPLPEAARLRADGLSNQALSLLDLGEPDRAEELWARALRADPGHPPTVHDRGLHRWRAGRCTDLELVAEVSAVASGRLLGQVHLERGDVEAAEAALDEALAADPGDGAARAALDRAAATPRGTLEITDHVLTVTGVALTASGHLALTCSRDGAVRVWDTDSGECARRLEHRSGLGPAAVAVSADGAVAASGSEDGSVRVWHLGTGRELASFAAHAGGVRGVALAPDGRLLLTAGDDGAVRLWTAGGRRLRALADGRGATPSRGGGRPVGFGAGAAWVAVSGGPAPVSAPALVWPVAVGASAPVAVPGGPAVVVSAGGRAVLAVTADGAAVTTRPPAEGRWWHAALPAGWSGTAVAVTDDGRAALTGGADGLLRLWDLPGARLLRTVPAHRHRVDAVALSGDGRLALSGSSDHRAVLRMLPTDRWRAPWSYVRPRSSEQVSGAAAAAAAGLRRAGALTAAGRPAEAVAALRAVRALPGYGRDPAVLDAWRRAARSGRPTEVLAAWRVLELPVRAVPAHDSRWGSPVALSADGALVVVGADDGAVEVWEPAAGTRRHRLTGHARAVVAVALTPDGATAASVDLDGELRSWDLRTGAPGPAVPGERGGAGGLVVTADGVVAACAGPDGGIRVADLRTGRVRHRLPAADGFVQALAADPTGAVTVSCGRGAPVLAWDLPSGRRTAVLAGHDRYVRAAAVAPGAAYAITGGDDRTARIWDPRTGDCRHVLTGHGAEVVAVAAGAGVSLTAGPDALVRVWDVVTGRGRHALAGHAGWVGALAVAPDGRTGLSGGDDGAVRVWDLGTGRCLRVLEGHPGPVDRVAVGADGRFVLAGTSSGTAVVWELDRDVAFPA
jgi:WD40 repeat protein/serine/threonine protein kinase